MHDQAIRIRVRDVFSVTAEDGIDLTPSSKKARGILALLCFAPGHRRPRDWIAAHLWSDRRPENARASARQDVLKLRRTLGAYATVLQGEGTDWIGLDPERIVIDDAGTGLLFEDLVVRDAAFTAWLERLRASDGGNARALEPTVAEGPREDATPPAPPSSGPHSDRIMVRCIGGSASGPGALGELIAHRIGDGIEERIRVQHLAAPGAHEIDVEVRCDVFEGDGVSIVLVKVVHPASGIVLHTRQHRLDGPAALLVAGEDGARMAQEVAEIAVEELPHALGVDRPALRGAAYGQIGLCKLFSYDAAAMEEGDRWLVKAAETSGDGIHDAWRALGQVLRHVDLGQPRTPEMRDLIERSIRRAGERARRSGAVQGLIAFTQGMLDADPADSVALAADAVRRMPMSPLTLLSLSSAELRAGRAEAAYTASRLARRYAQGLRFHHWWDVHHCVTCVATGRIEEAIEAAEGALIGRGTTGPPQQHAAQRHLIALYAARGEVGRAVAMAEKLAQIEPGFSLDRMLRDPEYPVDTLRGTGVIRAIERML